MPRRKVTISQYTVDDNPIEADASVWSTTVPELDDDAGYISYAISKPVVAFQVWKKNALTMDEYKEGLAAANVLAGDIPAYENFGCPCTWIPYVVKLAGDDIPEYINRKPFNSITWDNTNHRFTLVGAPASRADVGADKMYAINDSGQRGFYDKSTVLSNQSGGSGSAPSVEHNLLSASHPDTEPSNAETGALIVGGNNNRWKKLVPGGTKYVLVNKDMSATWDKVPTAMHLEGGDPWPKLRTINGVPSDGPRYYGYNSRGEGPGFWKWSDVDCNEQPGGGGGGDGGGGGGEGPEGPDEGPGTECGCDLFNVSDSKVYPNIYKNVYGCTCIRGVTAYFIVELKDQQLAGNVESYGISAEILGVHLKSIPANDTLSIDNFLSRIVTITGSIQKFGIKIEATFTDVCNFHPGDPLDVIVNAYFEACRYGGQCTLSGVYSHIVLCQNGTNPNDIPPPNPPEGFPGGQPIGEIPPNPGGGLPFEPPDGDEGAQPPPGGGGGGDGGIGGEGGGGWPGFGPVNPCALPVPPGGVKPPNLVGSGLVARAIEENIEFTVASDLSVATREIVVDSNGPEENWKKVKLAVFEVNNSEITDGTDAWDLYWPGDDVNIPDGIGIIRHKRSDFFLRCIGSSCVHNGTSTFANNAIVKPDGDIINEPPNNGEDPTYRPIGNRISYRKFLISVGLDGGKNAGKLRFGIPAVSITINAIKGGYIKYTIPGTEPVEERTFTAYYVLKNIAVGARLTSFSGHIMYLPVSFGLPHIQRHQGNNYYATMSEHNDTPHPDPYHRYFSAVTSAPSQLPNHYENENKTVFDMLLNYIDGFDSFWLTNAQKCLSQTFMDTIMANLYVSSAAGDADSWNTHEDAFPADKFHPLSSRRIALDLIAFSTRDFVTGIPSCSVPAIYKDGANLTQLRYSTDVEKPVVCWYKKFPSCLGLVDSSIVTNGDKFYYYLVSGDPMDERGPSSASYFVNSTKPVPANQEIPGNFTIIEQEPFKIKINIRIRVVET